MTHLSSLLLFIYLFAYLRNGLTFPRMAPIHYTPEDDLELLIPTPSPRLPPFTHLLGLSNAWDGTQGFVQARHMLYQQKPSPSFPHHISLSLWHRGATRSCQLSVV